MKAVDNEDDNNYEIGRKLIQVERWRKTDSVLIFKRQIVLDRYPLYPGLYKLKWQLSNAVHCTPEIIYLSYFDLQQL